jgi:chromosome segregation ATPase
MTDDPRALLLESLQASPDGAAALAALGHALAWATESLDAVDLKDEMVVFRQVAAASDAFIKVGPLVAALAPLVDSDVVGATIRQRLNRCGAHLEETREKANRIESELAVLRERETELRAAAAAHEELTARRVELRRMVELAGELPELRARLAETEADAAAIHAEVTEAENDLRRGADRLLRVSEDQRALLAPDLGRLMDEAAQAETALAAERARHRELEGKLADHLAGFERLREDHGKLPGLQAYAAAERELIDGFALLDAQNPEEPPPDERSPLSRASAAIADAERRLTELDTLLKPVLERHAEAYEQARALLTWTS